MDFLFLGQALGMLTCYVVTVCWQRPLFLYVYSAAFKYILLKLFFLLSALLFKYPLNLPALLFQGMNEYLQGFSV